MLKKHLLPAVAAAFTTIAVFAVAGAAFGNTINSAYSSIDQSIFESGVQVSFPSQNNGTFRLLDGTSGTLVVNNISFPTVPSGAPVPGPIYDGTWYYQNNSGSFHFEFRSGMTAFSGSWTDYGTNEGGTWSSTGGGPGPVPAPLNP